MKNLGKNIVILLALMGAGFFLAYIRFRPHLTDSTSFTDGESIYDQNKTEAIRYALWEEPLAFDGRINSDEDELRPALSPDGRFLVFGSGQQGLNQDLYISEVVDGAPQEPRPLWEVNTDFDETAAAFSNDALYFASNRPGGVGGMDLWRVPYRDSEFGNAELLVGLEVNTAFDETDPAPVPGTLAVAFASDRKRGKRTDFDLYMAKPAGATGLAATSFVELNSPFDEREPAFVGDARTLVFTSDRTEGAKGGFDLYRSVREASLWLPPENLEGLNSGADERGPAPSPDGFSLVYSVQREGLSADLFRARSRELFRMPSKPVGWIDLLILVGLVLVALLAWLAKRWNALDLIYKCFMVALIIHLLLLWWFRDVYPQSGPAELPQRESMFKVKLAVSPSRSSATNKEFGGAVEAARSETAEVANPERADHERADTAEALTAAPQVTVARAETQLAENSERQEVQLAATSESEALPEQARETEVAQPTEEIQRRTSEASGLAVAVADDFKVQRSERANDNPERATAMPGDPTETEALPEQRTQTLTAQNLANSPEFSESASEMMAESAAENRDSAQQTQVAVAQPTEEIQRLNGSARTFEVEANDSNEFRPTVRSNSGPERQAIQSEQIGEAGEVAMAPSPELGGGLQQGTGGFTPGEESLAVSAPNRQQSEFRPDGTPNSALAEVDVNNAEHASDPSAFQPKFGSEAGPTAEETLVADLGASNAPEREHSEVAAPQRHTADTGSLATDLAGDPLPDLTATSLALDRPTVSSPSGPQRRMSDFLPTSDGSPVEALPGIALDDEASLPEAAQRGQPGEETESFENELLAGLTTADAPKRAIGDLGAPDRSEVAMSSPDDDPAVGPSFSPLVVMEEIRGQEPEVATIPAQLEHTPYRNRFGGQKDIALQEHGGSKETEAAVRAGLEYLASIQNEAGYWGSRSDKQAKYRHVVIGKTALSMLAFLGAGHTPESGTQYSMVSRKAVDFLLDVQDWKTGHFGDSASYGHGIATYALAECYALTKEQRLREPLEKAIKWILQKQHRSIDPKLDGGWGYYFPDADGYQSDRWPRVSVTSWQVMALESARIGGLEVPDESFERAASYLRHSVDPRYGYVRYSHDPSRLSSNYPTLPASTPAGLFAAALLGEDIESNYYKDAVSFTLERAPTGYAFRGDDAFVRRAEGNLYFWYYGSLAMFRLGGYAWDQWNTRMKDTLVNAQDQDGSWKPISIYARYAGDDWRDKSYTTAMCVLTLEVYYRYFTPLLSVQASK